MVNLISATIFIFLNPYTYSNPIIKSYSMYKWRNQVAKKQIFKSPDEYIPNFKGRINEIYYNFLNTNKLRNFNLLYLPIKVNDNFKYLLLNIEKVVFFLGLIYICKEMLFSLIKKRPNFPLILFLFISILVQIITASYLSLNWSRYYVQLVLFFTFIQSLGVAQVFLILKFTLYRLKIFKEKNK